MKRQVYDNTYTLHKVKQCAYTIVVLPPGIMERNDGQWETLCTHEIMAEINFM